ncbi:MAG: acylphosphatase [Acidobacteria bacterium]|nr:acylphosphatase [Acidobacteriota bacterium]
MTTWRWVVEGRVQGVGFRYFTTHAARSLGLRGWVRNRADGTVEIEVTGDASAVARLRLRVEMGPPGAHVSRIEEEALNRQPLDPLTGQPVGEGFGTIR